MATKRLIALSLILLAAGCSRSPEAKRDAHFKAAEKYFANQKYDEALIEYRNALQIDRTHIPSYMGLSNVFRQKGNYPASISALQQILLLDQNNIKAKIQLIRYMLTPDVKELVLLKRARTMSEEVLKIAPSNIEALVLLGRANARLGDYDEAVRQFQKVFVLDPGNLDAYLGLADAQFRKKDLKGSQQTLQEALKKHPESHRVYLSLGSFFFSNQQAAEAEDHFKKALELAPTDPECLQAIVGFYLSTKRPGEAERVLQQAINQNPNAREPRWDLADFYFQQNQPDKGMNALLELLKVNPQDRQALLRISELYLNKREEAKAEPIINSLLAADRTDAEAHFLMGKLLRLRGRSDKALEEFEAAIKWNNLLLPPYLQKADVLIQRGDLEGARKTLNAVLQLDANNLMARGALAKVLAAQQKPQEALEIAQEVLAAMPNNVDAIQAQAEALESLGKLGDAREDLLKLCKFQPGNPVYWYRLGLVEAALGDSNSAFTHVRKAIEIQPSFTQAINDILYLHIRAKKPDAALAELDDLSKLPIPPDEIHRFRGQIYGAKGDFTASEAEFRKAIAENPKSYQTYILLAQLKALQDKVPEALQEVDRLIAANSKLPSAYFLKGYYLSLAKDLKGTIENYRKAQELDPDNPVIANNLAWWLCETNSSLDEALRLAKLARSKAPENPDIADTLGWVYYKMKAPELAVYQFLFSIRNRVQPKAEPYYRLGMAYYAQGNLKLAQSALKKALGINANFANSEEARKVLQLIK